MRVLNYLSEVTFIRTSKTQRIKEVIIALTLSLAPLAAHPDGTIKGYKISVFPDFCGVSRRGSIFTSILRQMQMQNKYIHGRSFFPSSVFI